MVWSLRPKQYRENNEMLACFLWAFTDERVIYAKRLRMTPTRPRMPVPSMAKLEVSGVAVVVDVISTVKSPSMLLAVLVSSIELNTPVRNVGLDRKSVV